VGKYSLSYDTKFVWHSFFSPKDDNHTIYYDYEKYGNVDDPNDIHYQLDKDSYIDVNSGKFVSAYASYTHEMTNEWGTLCIPFNCNRVDGETFELYKPKSYTKTAMILEKHTGVIINNTPYIIKATGSKNSNGKYQITITDGDKEIVEPKTVTGETVYGLTMKGTYEKINKVSDSQTDVYFIAQNKFWKADDAITITPFHAWLEGGLAVNAKALNIFVDEDGELTSIGSIENGQFTESNEAGAVYNLNGQRLAEPQKGQINIINGRKVFVK